MWSDDRDRLDATIDEVARRMTEGAPPTDLRARILTRIHEQPVRFRWGRALPRLRWGPALAGLSGAVALIAIAVIMYRAPHVVRLKPDTTDTRISDTRTTDTRTTGTRTETSRRARAQTPRSPGPSERGAPVEPGAAAPSDIEAIAPAPLEMTSIQLARLPQTESIQVHPLETPALIAVTPLGSEEQGDRR